MSSATEPGSRAAAGGSLWTIDAEGINYQAGNVGIGAASDTTAQLLVDSASPETLRLHNGNAGAQSFAVYAEADSTLARTVFGDATSTSGQTVGVFGRAMSPDGFGVLGDAAADTGSATGVWGRTDSPDGYGIHGFNGADTGDAIGGYFETSSDDGYGIYAEAPTALSGYAGYFVGRGYFSNNVGIGTMSPGSPLTVAGLVESTTGGFKFPDGTIQTTAASGGGESLWQQSGSDIYYDAGEVGVGVSSPQAKLHVAGGQWDLANTEGDFKIGSGTYRLKIGVATGGTGAGHCRVFAGGPSSELILGVSGDDRVAVRSDEVDIVGPLEVDGFRLTESPTAGHVLTCDSAGTAPGSNPPAAAASACRTADRHQQPTAAPSASRILVVVRLMPSALRSRTPPVAMPAPASSA